jgi:hypothetical protein
MGIVAKSRLQSLLGLGGRVRAEGGLFCMGGWRSSAMCSDCVNLRGENKRHCRLERLIGSAVLVQALLSAALGPSTITVGVSGNVMTCHTRMAGGCTRAARLRSAAWCRRNRDRWRSRLR